ncbi:hypothetical protein BHM03_00044762 [Ensete ventricosum]|nr:hypothetical protein BHM03_00044762 [Ensete ventricosum]
MLCACRGGWLRQAPCRGGQPWPSYLQGMTGHSQAPCKGWPPTGATARRGSSPHGAATCRHDRLLPTRRGGDVGRRGGRPMIGRLPATKGSRRLRRGSDGGGAVRVKEGYGIFLRKRWLCLSEFEKF